MKQALCSITNLLGVGAQRRVWAAVAEQRLIAHAVHVAAAEGMTSMTSATEQCAQAAAQSPPSQDTRTGRSLASAATLGAPLTVPAGSAARNTSHASSSGSRSPVTVELRCITWL